MIPSHIYIKRIIKFHSFKRNYGFAGLRMKFIFPLKLQFSEFSSENLLNAGAGQLYLAPYLWGRRQILLVPGTACRGLFRSCVFVKNYLSISISPSYTQVTHYLHNLLANPVYWFTVRRMRVGFPNIIIIFHMICVL